MSVPATTARTKADRIAAIVGLVAFLVGISAIVWGAVSPVPAAAVATTVVSSPIPGGPVTTTVRETTPPTNPTREPRITQDETVVEGTGPGTVTVTSAPPAATTPWLGSRAADITFQVILVTFAALLLAFATHRVLLGQYGVRSAAVAAGGVEVAPVTEQDAVLVKRDVAAAREAPDLSRPLFEKASVTDPRMRLLQSRIALELAVRTLAQHSELPSGLSVPYVLSGLVEKKKMSPKLAEAITSLHDIGDRLGHGVHISLDTTTLLTEAYAQALAKVGGKIRSGR